MSEKKVDVRVDIATILTVLFIALKLCKVINWSWIWVLSPLWISLIITSIITIILVRIKRKD